MKSKMTLQQRLIFPIALLGVITLLSNILAVFGINNVHANAGAIVDEYMVSEAKLEEIRRSMMDLHRLALSHIVATDHPTMIRLVREIKDEEAALDKKLAAYKKYVVQKDSDLYDSLLKDYESFKHALVGLVCASADNKTQDAYAMANGDVAAYSGAATEGIDALYSSVRKQARQARNRLLSVYISALVISAVALLCGILLIAAAFRIVKKSVIAPIQGAMDTLQDSSQRISGVVGDVRSRTQNSNDSVQALYGLTAQLSAALEEIASSASVIRTNASDTQDHVEHMTQECAAITAYSTDMRGRAQEIQESAQQQIAAIRTRTGEILSVLDNAIQKSKNVDQIDMLSKDILSISSSTNLIAINASMEATRAGESGKGFIAVAREIRKLADACAASASHIQEVSAAVTEAVQYLAGSAQELVDYLNSDILSQFEQSVRSGQQYREDANYIESSIEAFNGQVNRLHEAMDSVAGSISNISAAIDNAALGVSGASGNAKSLVDDMAGIASRMHANQEIVGELQKQMDVFANL